MEGEIQRFACLSNIFWLSRTYTVRLSHYYPSSFSPFLQHLSTQALSSYWGCLSCSPCLPSACPESPSLAPCLLWTRWRAGGQSPQSWTSVHLSWKNLKGCGIWVREVCHSSSLPLLHPHPLGSSCGAGRAWPCPPFHTWVVNPPVWGHVIRCRGRCRLQPGPCGSESEGLVKWTLRWGPAKAARRGAGRSSCPHLPLQVRGLESGTGQ